jgi:purine-nucleoside phosphorylase
MAELSRRGVTDLLVMSAAGSTRRTSLPGEIVVINGVIDLQNRDRNSGRGRCTVDAQLTRRVESALTGAGLIWSRGTIASGTGPAYETPAEVTFLQRLGADLASMSSAPEITLANQLGMRVAALGVLTNPATGITGAIPAHGEVLSQALAASGPLAAVVAQLVVKTVVTCPDPGPG